MTRTTTIRDLSPPGEILAEALEERGITNSELARRTGLSEKHVSQLVNARVPLSMEVALQLERVLGIPARLWNSLEFNYRAEHRREEQRADMAQFADWMRGFPLRAMRKAGYFGDRTIGQGVRERVEALLEFFGVTSPETWETEWEFATGRFRKSPRFNPNHNALTAWLRRGELESQAIRCARFDEAHFRNALREARALTTQPPGEFIPALVDLCARAGVALTLIPSLPGLAISGVTRWRGPDKALVSLSLRFKSDDQLWFTFFHEACHVLEHKTATIYIDSAADPDGEADERRANEFARDTLIPPADFNRLVAGGRPLLTDVEAFARSIGVSPGVVVGRLQHEGILDHKHGNGLKRYFRWDFEE
jgi:HTH-type transcriptional regulator / antitoxin HigA